MSERIRYVPGMPWVLDEEGNRLPDLEKIRSCPFPTPYTASQFGARPRLRCDPDSSLTAQEFKNECDINTIMRRFLKTGALPVNGAAPSYGDFSNVTDYLDAFQQVTYAQEQFLTLPSTLRERFHHNPGDLLAFLADKANRDEAIKLGLIPAPTTPLAPAEPKAQTNDSTNKPA